MAIIGLMEEERTVSCAVVDYGLGSGAGSGSASVLKFRVFASETGLCHTSIMYQQKLTNKARMIGYGLAVVIVAAVLIYRVVAH